jgi:hypothetical protein
MATDQDKDKKDKKNDLSKPDPETLHTTDPRKTWKDPSLP